MMSWSFLVTLIIAIHWIQIEISNTSKLYAPSEWTAGNTKCKPGHKCGFHENKTYSWCYTNDTHWDYCCTGPCTEGSEETNITDYLWCESGTSWQYCGGTRMRDVQGRACIDTHRCGVHNEEGEREGIRLANWCYVDLVGTYGFCCADGWNNCSSYGNSDPYCYVSSDADINDQRVCNPEYP